MAVESEKEQEEIILSTNESVDLFAKAWPIADDKKHVIIKKGLLLPINMIEKWKEQYNALNIEFRKWCKFNALVKDENEVASYFEIEDARNFINIDELSINWHQYALYRLNGWESSKNNNNNQHLANSPINRIKNKLEFEKETGMDSIANPALYPDREFMINILSIGRDSFQEKTASEKEIASDAEIVDIWHISHELEREWHHQRHGAHIISSVIEKAVRDYTSFDYDPIEIYEYMYKKMSTWSMRHFHARQYKVDSRKLEIVVRRLAMKEMIKNESTLVIAINQAYRIKHEAPPKLDEARIEKLKRGTLYKPHAG